MVIRGWNSTNSIWMLLSYWQQRERTKIWREKNKFNLTINYWRMEACKRKWKKQFERNNIKKCWKVKSLDNYLIRSWRNRIKKKKIWKNSVGRILCSVLVHSERHYGNETPPEKVQEFAYIRTSHSFQGQ